MKKRIFLFVLIFLLVFPFELFAYTVDDLRDMVGKNRLDGDYTQSEIDIIINQYQQIERANSKVALFEGLMKPEEREKLREEYNNLQKDFDLATEELSRTFQSGKPLKDVLSCKSNLENIITKMVRFQDRGFNVEIEYIPNVWEEEYNKVQNILQKVEKDKYEIGDLGDSLEAPLETGIYLTSIFGMRLNPISKDSLSMHNGIDLFAEEGTNVYSLWNGVVSNVYNSESNGLTIEISHGPNMKSYYSHLSQSLVKIGSKINKGDKIALTGHSNENKTYLHFGVYLDGEYVNPLMLFGDKGLRALRAYVSNNPGSSDVYREIERLIKNEPTYGKEETIEEENFEGINEEYIDSKPFDRWEFVESFIKSSSEKSE